MKISISMLSYASGLCGLMFAVPAMSICLNTGAQLQILGSGGPGASGGRASSGYLLWIDGVSRFMVDAGSGTKDQFHQTGANSDDIELVALSHLHPDHSAELPAIFWPAGGSFKVAGPTGSEDYPSIASFLDIMFGASGAYSVLGSRLDLEIQTVDIMAVEPTSIWNEDDISISAIRVPHGDVPTLAYKFEFKESSIVFASDQNGLDPGFIDFIQGVDYLVIHLAGTEDATGVIADLHAKPSVWGNMVTAADVGNVIISHINAPTPQALEQRLTTFRSNYTGSFVIAEDLMCIAIES